MTTTELEGGTALADDRYPSRVAPEPRILPRRDPVVHGRAADGPLAQEQLDAFDRDGFLHLERVISPGEVRALLDEARKLTGLPELQGDERCIREPGDDTIRSIFEVHQISEVMGDLVADPRVAGPARQILGGEVYIHQSRVNLKPGFRGKEFYWHSDFETWHIEDGMPAMRALSASISLTDNHEQNGPLMIIPGSHRSYVSCVGTTPEDNYRSSLRRQEYGVPDDESLARLVEEGGIASLTGAAGSVVLFDANCMHGSNSNITPHPRANVFAVYNSMDNALVEPFGAPAPRPPFIANRTPTPLRST